MFLDVIDGSRVACAMHRTKLCGANLKLIRSELHGVGAGAVKF